MEENSSKKRLSNEIDLLSFALKLKKKKLERIDLKKN